MSIAHGVVIAVAVCAATCVCAAVGGIALVIVRLHDEGRGGCRGTGGRRMPARQGCRTTPAVDGPAAGDFGTLARAGWVDVDTVRTWETSTWR